MRTMVVLGAALCGVAPRVGAPPGYPSPDNVAIYNSRAPYE
jgi:hypothetical protein